MKVTKTIGRVSKIFIPFHNYKKLVGLEQLKESYQNASSSAAEIFKSKKSAAIPLKETFEEAVQRLNLTPEMLENRKQSFFKMALFYLTIASILGIYLITLLMSKSFLASLITFVLVIVALALFYREHFWYTQMKQKRLGLNFKDWVGYTFRGKE